MSLARAAGWAAAGWVAALALGCPQATPEADVAVDAPDAPRRIVNSAGALPRCAGTLRLPRNLRLTGHPQRDAFHLPCPGPVGCLTSEEDALVYRPSAREVLARLGPHALRWSPTRPDVASWRGQLVAGVSLRGDTLLLSTTTTTQVFHSTLADPVLFPTPALRAEERVDMLLAPKPGHPCLVVRHGPKNAPVAARVVCLDGTPLPLAAPIHWLEREVVGHFQVDTNLAVAAVGLDGRVWSRFDLQGPMPSLGYTPQRVMVTQRRKVRVEPAQGAPWEFTLAEDQTVVNRQSGVLILDGQRGLLERDAQGGVTPLVPQAGGHTTVAGAPLPGGAARERLQMAFDGDDRVAVLERVRLEDCRATDLVHLVVGRTVTTVASGDTVRMHPQFVLRTLHWVEGDPDYGAVTNPSGGTTVNLE